MKQRLLLLEGLLLMWGCSDDNEARDLVPTLTRAEGTGINYYEPASLHHYNVHMPLPMRELLTDSRAYSSQNQ